MSGNNKEEIAGSIYSISFHTPPSEKPTGVSGAEYRRQWNRLNKDRINLAGRRYSERVGLKLSDEAKEFFRERIRKNPNFKKEEAQRLRSGWEKAERRREPWDCIDDDLVMNFEGRDRELGKIIGRSMNAIQKRRHNLRLDSIGDSSHKEAPKGEGEIA